MSGRLAQMFRNPDWPQIESLLRRARTIAVVGLSDNPARPSHGVAAGMQRLGYRIIPVNPVAAASGETILGETVYATLTDAARHHTIDLVNVFRNSEDVPPVVDEALAIGAPAVWLQLGIRHEAQMQRAQAAGLMCVQDRCLKVEHARRMRSS